MKVRLNENYYEVITGRDTNTIPGETFTTVKSKDGNGPVVMYPERLNATDYGAYLYKNGERVGYISGDSDFEAGDLRLSHSWNNCIYVEDEDVENVAEEIACNVTGFSDCEVIFVPSTDLEDAVMGETMGKDFDNLFNVIKREDTRTVPGETYISLTNNETGGIRVLYPKNLDAADYGAFLYIGNMNKGFVQDCDSTRGVLSLTNSWNSSILLDPDDVEFFAEKLTTVRKINGVRDITRYAIIIVPSTELPKIGPGVFTNRR